MSDEENNQPQEEQNEGNQNNNTIPDYDPSSYIERGLNTDDTIEK